MSFFIKIKKKGKLCIPEDSGYVPPNPQDTGSISLSGTWMNVAVKLMTAAKVVDGKIIHPGNAKGCRQGMIPGFKFFFNDGARITKEDAAKIAQEVEKLKDPALQRILENLRNPVAMDDLKQLQRLWIAFNKVAAANNGYTVK